MAWMLFVDEEVFYIPPHIESMHHAPPPKRMAAHMIFKTQSNTSLTTFQNFFIVVNL
jgi:hypothetical protein